MGCEGPGYGFKREKRQTNKTILLKKKKKEKEKPLEPLYRHFEFLLHRNCRHKLKD